MAGKVELYQITPVPNVLCMGYIIRTVNDKIIVIDGGHISNDFSNFIHSAIRAILGLNDGEYFEVDAWFITHCHDDHFGELLNQFERYDKSSNFCVKNFYFDFPDFKDMAYKDAGQETLSAYERLKKAFDNYAKVNAIAVKGKSFLDDLNGAVINSEAIKKGLTIDVDGVRFEVLQTHCPMDTLVNSSSVVMKMHVGEKDNAQTVLFLADSSAESGERLLKTYGDRLKSDIVQMAHHGNWAVKKDVYDAVNAKVKLWPTAIWIWEMRNPNFDLDKVREWVNTTSHDKFNLVACCYDAYPENRESIADWKKVLDGMKIALPCEL